jgi:hypothetical protein
MPKSKNALADKQKATKAEKAKKREQSLKDKTFGLKNKGKSKKVQNQVAQMTRSMGNDPSAGGRSEAQNRAKKAQKEAEEAAKRDMELMFKSVKKKETNQQVRKVEVEEVKKVVKVAPEVRIKQLLEGKLPDIAGRTLEDRIEEARTLVEKKTKMTEEVFFSWLARKEKEKRDMQKKEKEQRWKSNKYTGKEIWLKFKVKAVDDDDAVDAAAYDHDSNPPSDNEEEEAEDLSKKMEENLQVDPTV